MWLCSTQPPELELTPNVTHLHVGLFASPICAIRRDNEQRGACRTPLCLKRVDGDTGTVSNYPTS